MNQKELREIRKRFNPDKESFSRITAVMSMEPGR